MQNLQNIEDKIFFECKNVLESLSKINSVDELLRKQDLFYEVSERIAFLKFLEKNKESLVAENPLQIVENQDINDNFNEEKNDVPEVEDNHESQDLEEVIFNNELNEIHSEVEIPLSEGDRVLDEVSPEISESEEVPLEEEVLFENDLSAPVSEDYNQKISEKERIFLELEEKRKQNLEKSASESQFVQSTSQFEFVNENQQPEIEKVPEVSAKNEESISENRRKIVEFEKGSSEPHPQTDYFKEETTAPRPHHDKKFKLAHIKGLKTVQSLFDDDPLEHIQEEKKVEEHPKHSEDSGSLRKSNVSTDFMEAEKPRAEFRLDLNDKISFSKYLFDGSQVELNDAINQLNSYKTLDEAKEFLSELYYEKNWKKVDEYAQRLWTLVENKFL